MNLDWRTKTILIGGTVGALFGMGAAYLYIRAAEKEGRVPAIEAGQAAQVGLALLALLRQITALPAEKKTES